MVVIVKPTPEERSKYLDSALKKGGYTPKEKEYARIKQAPDTSSFTQAGIRYRRAGEEYDLGNYGDAYRSAIEGTVQGVAGAVGKVAELGVDGYNYLSSKAMEAGRTAGKSTQKYLDKKVKEALGAEREKELAMKLQGNINKGIDYVSGWTQGFDKHIRENPKAGLYRDVVTLGTSAIPVGRAVGAGEKIAKVASKTAETASKVAKPIAKFGEKAVDVAKQNDKIKRATEAISEFSQKPGVAKTAELGKTVGRFAKDFIKENPATATVAAGTLVMGGSPGDIAANTANSFAAEKLGKSKAVQGIKSKPLKNFAEGALAGQSFVPATIDPTISGIATLGGGLLGMGAKSDTLQKSSRSFVASDASSAMAQNPDEFMKNFGGANINKSDFLKEVTGGAPIEKENMIDGMKKVTDRLVRENRITGDKAADYSKAEVMQKGLLEKKASLIDKSVELGGRVELGTNEHAALIKSIDDAEKSITDAMQEATSRTVQPGTVSVSKNMQQALDRLNSIKQKTSRAKPGDSVDLNMQDIEFLMTFQKKLSYFGGRQAVLQGSEAGASKVDVHDNIYNTLLEMQGKSAKSTFGEEGYNTVLRLNQSIRENRYVAETLQGRALTDAFGGEGLSERLLGRGLSLDLIYGNPINTALNLSQSFLKGGAQKAAAFLTRKDKVPTQNVDTGFAGKTTSPEFIKDIPKLPGDSGKPRVSPTVQIRPTPQMPDRIPNPSKVKAPETDWKAMAAEQKNKEKQKIQLFKQADKDRALAEKQRIKAEKEKQKEQERIAKEKAKIKAQKAKEKEKQKKESGKIKPFPEASK